MSNDVAEIEAKIRALSPTDKVELIRSLIADLDGPEDTDVEQAWLDEAESRHRQLLDGEAQGIPGERVFDDLRARLNAAR